MQIITGNLLDSSETYLCHQCNCVSNRSAHLAEAVFKKFPWADIYSKRTYPWTPPEKEQLGDIIICGNDKNRLVINMLAQYYPGRSRFPHSKTDGILVRQDAFKSCLIKIAKSAEPDESIAFPWGIGCGAAGGDWGVYLKMIQDFDNKVQNEIRLYKLE